MPNGTAAFGDSSWSDAMKEVQRKAVALDERRMEQINRQIESINRLLRQLTALELFCAEKGLQSESRKFVEKELAEPAPKE